MKITGFPLVTLGLTAVCAYAAPHIITSYKQADAIPVMMPAMTDSVDNKGEKFEIGGLLNTRVTDDFTRLRTTPVAAKDSGLVALKAPAKGYDLDMLQTNLRAARFAKGTLKVTSPARFEVLVNGESKAKKTTAEDSIAPASTQSIPLSLEPERDYTVTIRVLADANSKTEPTVKAVFEPDKDFENIEIFSGSGMKQRFYVDNCVEGTRVRSVDISPNGKYVLARYAEYFGPNDYQYTATVFDTSSGAAVAADLPYPAAWLPTTNALYYTKKSQKGQNLYRLSFPSMKTECLLRDVESESITFTPDEKSILYYRRQEGKKEEGIMRRVTNPDDRQPGNRDVYYLVKQDIATGNTTTLTYGARKNTMLDISPDSKRLLYMASKETPSKWPFYSHCLIQMDLATLATDTIVREDGAITGAVYSPDGQRVLVLGGPNMLDKGNLNIGDHPIPNDFDTQASILDLKTGKITSLTRDFDPAITGTPVWNAADGCIYFTAEAGFYQNLYRYNPKTARFNKLDINVDVVRSFSINQHEDKALAYVGSTLDQDGAAYILDLKKGTNRLIDNPLAPLTDKIEWGKTEPWTFTASDGTVIDGEITLPPNFDPNRKYPLIVYYYGGTSPSNHRIDHPYNPNVFASRDYVVYILNPSGTTGYGQEFSARHVNAWGKRTADDIIEGVKAFVKAHPFVDEKKIGCLGASYGGFMTQYLQTLTDIFACAVSHAGISDVTSYWGEGYWGYSYNSVAAAQSYPWNNPELFTKQGSLFNADKIHTPLLLLHGNADTNVPIGESIQIFNALKILGRDVEFIEVDGSNHVVTDPDKRRVWQNTIMAWFAKYLQDDPSWWNDLYGK